MSSEPQASKFDWMDNLRAIATIAVIVIHTSGLILYRYGAVPFSTWLTGNGYDSMARFAVPIFVMLTGALLLPRQATLAEFFKKRITRIVLPFIFWSLAYLVYNIYIKHAKGGRITPGWLLEQFRDGTSGHLWYVYMIIGIYLFIPILSKWVNNSTVKDIVFFLIIWVITLFKPIPLVAKFFPAINLVYFTGFIGYAVLGHYLTVKAFAHYRRIGFILFAVGVLVTFLGTIFLSRSNKVFSGDLYDYLMPNVMLSSAGIFLLCKNSITKTTIIVKIRNFINLYSYGIYLGHVLVLKLLDSGGINWGVTTPLISVPAITLLCLSITACIVYVIHKLPFGKYVSG